MGSQQLRIVAGISGSSGAIYGIRLLELLRPLEDIETHLIISQPGEYNIRAETGRSVADVKALADFCYDIDDLAAPLASGSFKHDGMIVAPCSVRTMSGLANSYSANLLLRAGDVTLKERRRLVLLVRETPLHLGHLRNMERLAEMGAIIMPPVPAFYYKPTTLKDIIDHTVGKALDALGIEHPSFRRWEGTGSDST